MKNNPLLMKLNSILIDYFSYYNKIELRFIIRSFSFLDNISSYLDSLFISIHNKVFIKQ